MSEIVENTSKVYYSYDQIHNTVRNCVERCKKFDPDVIIAIGGGGFIPARMLRTHIDVPILAVSVELYVKKESSDNGETFNSSKPVITQWFNPDSFNGRLVKGGKVLVVDEVDDTRTTLSYVINHLLKVNSPESVAAMVVHNKNKHKLGVLDSKVIYIEGENVEDKWIKYPWDIMNPSETETPPNRVKILDKGFLELVDTFGDELTIVNAARVSFGVQKTKLSKGDVGLIKYLYKHKHFSPFRHIMFRFHIKAPEFIMRQWYKHVVGAETTGNSCTKDHAWNEISGRYKPVEDFYMPETWRKQSKDSKQASDGVVTTEQNTELDDVFNEFMENTLQTYRKMLEMGVAKEQARIVLPLSQYTEVIWTASAQAVLNFIYLRDEATAQVEIREYAKVMREMLKEKFPTLHDIWFEEN